MNYWLFEIQLVLTLKQLSLVSPWNYSSVHSYSEIKKYKQKFLQVSLQIVEAFRQQEVLERNGNRNRMESERNASS